MEEIAFNLLREPWIRVMEPDGSVAECSLMQTLLDSHQYLRLAGELPTQDVAILRLLLLAVLHTVFYRVDTDGEEAPLEEREDALDRWKDLWDAGRLPERPIREYLMKYEDRFWLFHPENPFYQVPSAVGGTYYSAAKLNDTLSESANKLRLFAARTGEDKASLSYAEAVRWLLYLNGFDDTSAKPKGKGLPSPGAGWLGKLGLIYAEGNTLFETLLLNLVLLDNESEPWGNPRPVWELEIPRSAERTEIIMPDNQAELLTLQSRRILLERKAEKVSGCTLLGGDFFQKINATAEQMTIWSRRDGKKNEAPYDLPKRLEADRQMWRDFSVITGMGSSSRTPGVVRWIALLKKERILDRDRLIRLRVAGVKYGDKDFFVEDILADHLDFYTSLLEKSGEIWAELIQDKISQTEHAARVLRTLADELYLAEGGSPAAGAQKARADEAAQEYYASVDIPFRTWLRSIDPAQGDDQDLREDKDIQWRETAYRLAVDQGKRMIRNAGERAFVGRWIMEQQKSGKKANQQTHHSSAEAFDQFKKELWTCFRLKHQERGAADA